MLDCRRVTVSTMNISSLLSPDPSPAPPTPPPAPANPASTTATPRKQRARPKGGKRTSSGLSQEVKLSPDRTFTQQHVQAVSSRGLHQQSLQHSQEIAGFRPLHQPTSNPSAEILAGNYGHAHAQQSQRPESAQHRHPSAPHIDSLAGSLSHVSSAALPHTLTHTEDLALNQHHQHQASAASLRPTDAIEEQRSPSATLASSKPLLGRQSSGQSISDLTMAEAPSQPPPPRNFTSSALSETDASRVNDLLAYLGQNSYAYDSHVELINLLHKGFLAHVNVPTGQESRTPQSYGLLNELRQAREAMDTRFAVGEDLWVDWFADETLLASTSEERIALTEHFQKAVQDEPASVKLWQAFIDWIASNHTACQAPSGAEQSGWTAEDLELCRELFTKQMLVDYLEQAVAATQWRIDASHLIWDRYAQAILQDLPEQPSGSEYVRVRDIFMGRLQTPHATSSETAQTFWPIMSKGEGDNWEAVMDQVNEGAAPARKQMALRDEREHKLQRALESQDQAAIFQEFTDYIHWSAKHKSRGVHVHELHINLYERALLRFPTYTDWWLALIDLTLSTTPTTSALPLIERATRHCPWSGDLWATRILRSDVEGLPHPDIEATKHRATNSGLLDVGGMEELLKVLQQWCAYLRRHAFSPNSSEDDLDTAEVGITMALEDIQQAGQNLYGPGFAGDPLYRLETIQIKFFSEARRFADARAIYRRMVPAHKSETDFWQKHYLWELLLWSWSRISEKHRVETSGNGPDLATEVLQEALSQRGLDHPERIQDLYANHFLQHESGARLEQGMIAAREFGRVLAVRRAKEAEAAPVEQPVQETVGKRKASEELTNGDASKKSKTAETAANTGEEFSEEAKIKRDREHNTITLRNLAANTSATDIQKFFREVGKPLSITLSANASIATVEFSTPSDVLAAKTFASRPLNGTAITISSGSQNTLYLANYPPEWDEPAIRNLLGGYGEILSVRFPSLKFNARRRFCYVQFLTDAMAAEVEAALDGKALDASHRLVAKISDPDAKKARSGAQAEGREVFVKNLEREASEAAVKEFFAQYGEVASLNLVKLVNGKRTGTAFVVFATAAEAEKALAANNRPFGERILQVEMSSAKGGAAPVDKAKKLDVIIKHSTASPEPDVRRESDVSMASASAAGVVQNDEAYRTARERKIAIFDLPDTVNDARIRAAMEAYGPIVKIQLRRQDNGAIVEFADVKAAFNVRQGVECKSLGEGVRTGDVGELLSKVKKRQEGAGGAAVTAPVTASAGLGPMRPAGVSRPGQQRGGRRGGLGFKRGGTGIAVGEKNGTAAAAKTGGGCGSTKSNDDFRAIFERGKVEAKPDGGDGA